MAIKSNLMKAAGLGVVVAALSTGAAFAAVATGAVNVRTGPSTGYSIVDTLTRGENVTIVDQSNGWCAVQKTGPDGWVSCAYLANAGYQPRPVRPSVSLSFGFGAQQQRPPMHSNDHHWSNNGGWSNNGDNGPGWYGQPRNGGSFAFGF